MKNILKLFAVCCFMATVLSSFTINRTLTNESEGQTLSLYQNGQCVITGPNYRGTGTYDISGSTIYITWDNGATQQGKYMPTGSQYHTERICIEGVCYDAPRKVRSRS